MGTAEDTTLTDRQRYWLERVRECEASGQTVTEYAAQHGVSAQAMYAGKKMLVRKGILPPSSPDRFQRVRPVATADMSSEWRIQLPNGVSVIVCGAVDSATLATVLTSAAALG